MKRFLTLLTIMTAHSLFAMSEQQEHAPASSEAVAVHHSGISPEILNDPCYIKNQLMISETRHVKNDPQYKALRKNAKAIAQQKGWEAYAESPELKALDAFIENQQSIAREKNPVLKKAFEECQVIEHEFEILLNEFKKTPEAQAEAAAEKQFSALVSSFPDVMDENQKSAARAQIAALVAKLQPIEDKANEVLTTFMASHGYRENPVLGYRKIATV